MKLVLPKKITRDAFLYLDPKPPFKDFANCRSCMMFTGTTCTIHGPKVPITAGHSCGYYVHGKPMSEETGHELALVTPEESGLIKAQVRCEHCRAFLPNASTCNLFTRLNATGGFHLDPNVHPQGCCNGWVGKG